MMETIQHKLQQFDPGVVWLDKDNRIMSMNDLAMETFRVRPGELIGEEILRLHPEPSREKVRQLLEQSSDPANSPPPMTVMINIPERVLMIKVSRMFGKDGEVATCMIFYDLTDASTRAVKPQEEVPDEQAKRKLHKLPVYRDKQVLLVDLKSICCIKADGRYSTLYTENEEYFCNLSISDLENRLDARFFFRIHRSHMVNLRYAKAFEKIDEQCYLIIDHHDGIRVPISRNKVNSLKQVLGLN
ncbi:MAG: LytTR family transcriptional regulator DNA-binding domain-containing protein [Gammaproteobacteria bacterium]|nr:LytTR family transcriptional regulator DNA-binding domain-containing protein [Gammaproteobacteria bacterium]